MHIDLNTYHKGFLEAVYNSEDIVKNYLGRIEKYQPKLQAFEYVDSDNALRQARYMDQLRDAGVNLGPLMGVPVAIKDVLAVDGLPGPHLGSNADWTAVFNSREGSLIKALRAAGCIILGTTKTVEFCLGITGVSEPRGTPWNPWDWQEQRIPGGSSSGSAVAVAAGLCAFAIGTDTGGSVRVPAAFNGIFSLKTSFGLWPSDGVFPLDPNVDSLGLLTRNAADAQLAFHAINQRLFGYKYSSACDSVTLRHLTFGTPNEYFFADLEEQNSAVMDSTLDSLQQGGVTLTDCTIPGATQREKYFPVSLPAHLLATLGIERYQENKEILDPIVANRIESAITQPAHVLIGLENERQHYIKEARAAFAGLDAWITPTTVGVAPLLSDFDDPDKAMAHALGMTRNTQPGNYLEFCAVSLPNTTADYPVGIQLMAPAGLDARLLAIAVACEEKLGRQEMARLP